ncbi:MAG: hypothetical protein LC100_15030 [Chitinophagales bacterium]|nr:hypothetical protein [Chitinophagales bacterium]
MDDPQGYCNCNNCGTHQKIHKEVDKEPLHLYTPSDVAKVRKTLFDAQAGFDPILQQQIDIKGAVVDHDHTSQRVRGVLHRQTNSFEGKVQNAYDRCLKWMSDRTLPDILRSLADYYEDTDRIAHTMPIHPGFLKRLSTDFNGLNEQGKKEVLHHLGQPQGSNGTERKKLFKKALLTRQFTFQQVKDLINQQKGNSNG